MKQEHVCVLGLGETGISMVKWAINTGARVRVADTRESPPMLNVLRAEYPDVTFVGGPFTEKTFEGVDRLLISPGVPVADPAIQAAMAKGIQAAGDCELFAESLRKAEKEGHPFPKIIGITGSNGKTTVTSVVGAMCKAAGLNTQVAGNISPAVLTAWETCQEKGVYPEAWVLELSSFQLETTHTLPLDAAVILNISEDHLDRYDGMQGYIDAKKRIFLNCHTAVLNRDEPLSSTFVSADQPVLTFGLDAPSSNSFGLVLRDGEEWFAYGDNCFMKVADAQLKGRHNVSNLLASFALSYAAGVPFEAMVETAKTFKGLPHRVEYVTDFDQIAFYDDSKGTNVGATVAALQGIGAPVVVILGGDGKGQDFSPMREAVDAHARAVMLIGRDADIIANALEGTKVPMERAATLQEAVRRGYALAQPGDIVLLSPACASWDMFDGYAHRARVFIEEAMAIKQERESNSC